MKEDIKMDLRGIVWGAMGWTNLALDRDWCRALANMVINL
jgi:hypothetical protein